MTSGHSAWVDNGQSGSASVQAAWQILHRVPLQNTQTLLLSHDTLAALKGLFQQSDLCHSESQSH